MATLGGSAVNGCVDAGMNARRVELPVHNGLIRRMTVHPCYDVSSMTRILIDISVAAAWVTCTLWQWSEVVPMDDDNFWNIGLQHTVGDHTFKGRAGPVGGIQYLHEQLFVLPVCSLLVPIIEPTVGLPQMTRTVGWHFP